MQQNLLKMAQVITPNLNPRTSSAHSVRFFSIDSTRSSTDARSYESQTVATWKHSFRSLDFLLKIAELIIAVICTGLYSKALKLMEYSITSMMFPNIVFSAFIIITSVIAMSYVLGHVMPDILTRIFNILGAILYFVSAGITGHTWNVIGRNIAEDDEDKVIPANTLLAQAILSFLNAILYGTDVYISIKRTLASLDITEN